MHIDRFIAEMETVAPTQGAEEFDEGRIGLVVAGKTEITTVCAALDATQQVVEDAVRRGADMLVVHHTPIWHPLTRIQGYDADMLRTVLGAGLNIFVMHTNFDHAQEGINDALADLLGLTERVSLSLGVLGTCALSPAEIGGVLKAPLLVYGTMTPPCRLAVVGGSGCDMDLIDEAAALGAEAFLSSEAKHSVLRSSPVPLLVSTHYATENPGMRALAKRRGWDFLEDDPAPTVFE